MSKRIPELDGLRALALIAVFLEHSAHVRMMWMGVDLFLFCLDFLSRVSSWMFRTRAYELILGASTEGVCVVSFQLIFWPLLLSRYFFDFTGPTVGTCTSV